MSRLTWLHFIVIAGFCLASMNEVHGQGSQPNKKDKKSKGNPPPPVNPNPKTVNPNPKTVTPNPPPANPPVTSPPSGKYLTFPTNPAPNPANFGVNGSNPFSQPMRSTNPFTNAVPFSSPPNAGYPTMNTSYGGGFAPSRPLFTGQQPQSFPPYPNASVYSNPFGMYLPGSNPFGMLWSNANPYPYGVSPNGNPYSYGYPYSYGMPSVSPFAYGAYNPFGMNSNPMSLDPMMMQFMQMSNSNSIMAGPYGQDWQMPYGASGQTMGGPDMTGVFSGNQLFNSSGVSGKLGPMSGANRNMNMNMAPLGGFSGPIFGQNNGPAPFANPNAGNIFDPAPLPNPLQLDP